MPADLILTNAKIFTADPNRPWASALAVRDGKFVDVGDDAQIDAHRGPQTEVRDLNGQLVLPGLTDAHIHFTWYALSLRTIDLFEVPSLAEMQARVKAAAQQSAPDRWLRGRGWNHNLWPGRQLPTRWDLDQVSPHHPLFLSEKSGHAAIANSLALQLAGLTDATPNPPGGELVRDGTGRLTGVLLEGPAINLVARVIPETTDEELDDAVLQAQSVVHSLGLIGVHDLDGKQGFGAFQRLRQRGQLKLRAVSHVAMDQLDHAIGLGLRAGLGDEWLRVGGLKLFADGALGPKTAAMIEPYENDPQNYGITVVDKEEILEMASRASAAGLPTLVHAIGDRANHDVLDVFQAVRGEEAARGDARTHRRHRIEHVQVLHPQDLQRLAELDVIASVQPIHATQDMEIVDAYWGQRGQYAYAFRTLIESGAHLALGSDAPVETPNPFVGIHAAVTRRRANGFPGPQGWHPEQALTVAEAVTGYTLGAAYAECWEDQIGSITPGKWADFILPDRDIFEIDPMQIVQTQVRLTVVGGEVVYAANVA